jgi:hypothetical protein
MILAVHTPDVARLWGTVLEPMLAPVVATTRGCYETVDVLRAILNGEQILWVAMSEDGKTIEAVFTTAIRTYPRRKTCQVIYTAGTGLERWGIPFVETIEKYAREQGATAIEGSFRRGWARKYPGMKETGAILFKELAP